MVKIRLARGGAKKNPFYSIVATDSRKRRDSGYIERIGYFNPVARGQEVRLQLEEDRLSYWISQGAQISDRVKQLVKEYRDPSIREKQLAMQAAKADEKAKKIAAEEKAKADLEAKEAAEAAAQEAAAQEAPAEEAAAEAPAEEAAAEAPAEEAAAEAPAEEAAAEAPAEEAAAEEAAAEAPAEEAAEKPAEEPEEK
jgi:small subunit ribosomal protein S16